MAKLLKFLATFSDGTTQTCASKTKHHTHAYMVRYEYQDQPYSRYGFQPSAGLAWEHANSWGTAGCTNVVREVVSVTITN